MTKLQKKWLDAVPWESVVNINQALCRDIKPEPGQEPPKPTNPKTYETARQLWENSVPKSMTLKAVLDVCRECNDLIPFTFNNGNTFSAVGKTLVEDLISSLGAVEAHIVRTTVGHYVAGLIEKGELQEVLRHFEKMGKEEKRSADSATPLPAPQPQPQVSLP